MKTYVIMSVMMARSKMEQPEINTSVMTECSNLFCYLNFFKGKKIIYHLNAVPDMKRTTYMCFEITRNCFYWR